MNQDEKLLSEAYEKVSDLLLEEFDDEAPAGIPGTVYLIHFAKPYYHAKHYVGWTTAMDQRINLHKKGLGANLLRVLKDNGIEWKVSRIWKDATRNFERIIKSRWKKTPKLCPVCKGEISYEDLVDPEESEAPAEFNR